MIGNYRISGRALQRVAVLFLVPLCLFACQRDCRHAGAWVADADKTLHRNSNIPPEYRGVAEEFIVKLRQAQGVIHSEDCGNILITLPDGAEIMAEYESTPRNQITATFHAGDMQYWLVLKRR